MSRVSNRSRHLRGPGIRALLLSTLALVACAADNEVDHGVPPRFRAPRADPAETRIAESAQSRPNVLLISFDNVRADRMSCYGGPRATTPNLDALASRSTLFENCIAQAPYTPHSYGSLFSSLYVADLPVRARARGVRGTVMRAGLEEYHTTLPEVLQDAGYITGAIFRGWFTEAFGLTQGYDWASYKPRSTARVVDTAIERIDEWNESEHGKPFFLFAYSIDVHYPFMKERKPEEHLFGGDPDGFNVNREAIQRVQDGEQVPPDDLDNAIRLYDEGLYWSDHELARLFDALDERGIADSTIIVFASDHGEEFCEHGYLSHGQSNFRTVVQVPLIIHDPRLPIAQRVFAPVANIDIMPTILDLCGVDVPSVARGLTLADTVWGGRQPELDYRVIFSEGAWNGFRGLVTVGRYSYLVGQDPQSRFLYDWVDDPAESRNLLSQLPRLTDRLGYLIDRHHLNGLGLQMLLAAEGSGVAGGPPGPEDDDAAADAPVLSPEQEEQLRALGYLDGT